MSAQDGRLEVPESQHTGFLITEAGAFTPKAVEELVSRLARLEEGLRRMDTGCRVHYGGQPPEYTCLDRQADARNPEWRASDEFRAKVLGADYPCLPCQARSLLADQGGAE